MALKISVGDYKFALGNLGAELEFKFKTVGRVNKKTIIRIYVPDATFILGATLTIVDPGSAKIV